MNGIFTFAHRWVGVALALFMLVWISSGALIAFVEIPSNSPGLRLSHTQSLAPREGWLSLGEALERSAAARAGPEPRNEGLSGGEARPIGRRAEPRSDTGFAEARLRRLDETPSWIIEDDRGQRFAISAINGGLIEVTPERAERIARAWLEVEAQEAPEISFIDTIDAPVGVHNAELLKPFHRFAVEDGSGSQVIVSARTGEVVQKLTRAQRALAFAGNWLHLFRWLDAVGAGDYRRGALSWASFLAATGALTGLVVGWTRWRPGFFGRPTYLGGRRQPFREFWLKYHFWAGLAGGTFALFWAASGFLSTNPGQVLPPANASAAELARFRGKRPAAIVLDWKPKTFLETGDSARSQGWTALVVDTNGDGKRGADDNEPGKPVDPAKDTRVPFGLYSDSWSPADDSVWGSNLTFPGYAVRVALGDNPPETALTEVYKVPPPGYGVRGADMDGEGVFWAALGSGHLASFDRRKCRGPLNGFGAEKGEKCPEGWSFYPLPGPGFAGAPGAAETPYYAWVDRFDIFGLGANTPFATGNQSDSLHALVGGRIVELRVPYPMGFYAKGIDGRIDDLKVGWKGRGLWATSGNRTPFHIEAIDASAPGAPGGSSESFASPLVVNFQLRPDPLAH